MHQWTRAESRGTNDASSGAKRVDRSPSEGGTAAAEEAAAKPATALPLSVRFGGAGVGAK